MNSMQTFHGMKIVVSPILGPRPVIEISPSFQWCTDAYRAKHNAWLLEQFGTVDHMYVVEGVLMVSRQRYESMRAAAMAERRMSEAMAFGLAALR